MFKENKNVKYDDIISISLPTNVTIPLSDAQRFIIGLREILLQCNIYKASLIQFWFKDGSSIGIRRALEETGLFNFKIDKD